MGQDAPDNVICEDGVCRIVAPEEAAAHRAATAAAPLIQMLGATLMAKGGASVATSSVSGKGRVLGLYFSAHWCGPCRQFTPQLAAWYENFKATNKNKADFEIAFVSADKSPEQFAEYFATMPFLALPYAERDLQQELSSTFKVRGIPSLVFLDAETGKVLNGSARDIVSSDPQGANFPWHPKTFSELLGDSLVDSAGKTHPTAEALAGKVKLLYFSASWCPPCRGFTPELVKTYTALKTAGKNVEVVFVSSDKDEAGFSEYLGHMPWLALPFAARAAKGALSNMFEVQGIPTLVIMDEQNELITADGRAKVSKDPTGVEFPWLPKPLEALDEDGVDAVNEGPCLILLLGGADAAAAAARADSVLLEIATAEHAAKSKLQFRWGLRSDLMPGKVIDFLKERAALTLDDGDALVLTNLTKQVAYQCAVSGPDMGAADAAAFLLRFKAGSLKALTFK